MGMFDSFNLKVVCPHCEEESIMDFQTKEFDCLLRVWDEGDEFNPTNVKIQDGIIRNVYGGCNSKKCRAWELKESGYNSGFGRGIECDVLIEKGIVKQSINVRELTT